MGSRKEEDRDPEVPVPSTSRSCLFLSLILLVWNFQATIRFLLTDEPHAGISPLPAHVRPGGIGAPEGSPTVRQKYLLGNPVDINRATVEEIDGLPGISGTTAREVIEARDRKGKFGSLAELLEIPGIKEKRLKKILPFLAPIDNN